jgi:hypothetical protein
MSLDKAIDSVKDYINSRLKNPYFSAVIFVWLLYKPDCIAEKT